MPERFLAALGLKDSGVFMMGAVASKDWLERNWSDLVKLTLLVAGFAFAMHSTLKEHTAAIQDISETQTHIVQQQAENMKITNKILSNLALMEYRLGQLEKVTAANENDIKKYYQKEGRP